MKYYLAIDIGASSGRHILGWLTNGKIHIEEIHRFENSPVEKDGHLVWNVEHLFCEILNGLKKCKHIGKIPQSIGIDTWGVDYALLDEQDNLVGDIYCYRESRTRNVVDKVHGLISQKQLYSKTGIQHQPFNTIYQLYADKLSGKLDKAKCFLMFPDYLNFLLTGVKKQEYTNATTTGLVNAVSKNWDREIVDALNFPQDIFCNLVYAGTSMGNLKQVIQNKIGFDTTVVLPCTHDTASAVVAVPSTVTDTLYLSSGTWSLMGVELDHALTCESSQKLNYTNEGGYNFAFRYLKNIMGLWLIQSIRNQQNSNVSFDDIVKSAKENTKFPSVIDVNDSCFLSPKSMQKAICDYCVATGQPQPNTLGEIAFCVYNSLAKAYSDIILEIERQTGKIYDTIHIVGGGCRNILLNELTAKYSCKTVLAGPVEATAIGNLAVQMIADKQIENLEKAREMIANSFEIKELKNNVKI